LIKPAVILAGGPSEAEHLKPETFSLPAASSCKHCFGMKYSSQNLPSVEGSDIIKIIRWFDDPIKQ